MLFWGGCRHIKAKNARCFVDCDWFHQFLLMPETVDTENNPKLSDKCDVNAEALTRDWLENRLVWCSGSPSGLVRHVILRCKATPLLFV